MTHQRLDKEFTRLQQIMVEQMEQEAAVLSRRAEVARRLARILIDRLGSPPPYSGVWLWPSRDFDRLTTALTAWFNRQPLPTEIQLSLATRLQSGDPRDLFDHVDGASTTLLVIAVGSETCMKRSAFVLEVRGPEDGAMHLSVRTKAVANTPSTTVGEWTIHDQRAPVHEAGEAILRRVESHLRSSIILET